MTNEWKEEFKEIGKFNELKSVTAEKQGENTVRMMHHWAKQNEMDHPEKIGLRVIEIPPNGSIPGHDHNTDDFSSWLVAIQGSGTHWIEIGGRRIEHLVRAGTATVSTQKMSSQLGGLTYIHGFDALNEGLTLLNIYNVDEISDERLRDIQQGH